MNNKTKIKWNKICSKVIESISYANICIRSFPLDYAPLSTSWLDVDISKFSSDLCALTKRKPCNENCCLKSVRLASGVPLKANKLFNVKYTHALSDWRPHDYFGWSCLCNTCADIASESRCPSSIGTHDARLAIIEIDRTHSILLSIYEMIITITVDLIHCDTWI